MRERERVWGAEASVRQRAIPTIRRPASINRILTHIQTAIGSARIHKGRSEDAARACQCGYPPDTDLEGGREREREREGGRERERGRERVRDICRRIPSRHRLGHRCAVSCRPCRRRPRLRRQRRSRRSCPGDEGWWAARGRRWGGRRSGGAASVRRGGGAWRGAGARAG